MAIKGNIAEYIDSLIHSARMKHQVVYHQEIPPEIGIITTTKRPIPKNLRQQMAAMGIDGLYCHQSRAIDLVRSGAHVVVATPTASGKSLIYNLPVLERIQHDPDFKALYLFPLKALAQDQLRNFELMAAGKGAKAAIYDGDTSAWFRKKIRTTPPHVLMTNPDMLHLSLLPYHDRWKTFLSHLHMIVVDELHTYRGVMGSHMAQVFRRLQRICEYYGVAPTFVFSSATIANPDQLASQLTGLEVKIVRKSGAPRGKRHVILMNPDSGPAQTAILLLKAALHRGLRTIVYAQSRKMTELIAIWAGSESGPYKDRISAYRAGFLPEERREIEGRLANGDLLAVISTSALELGIDIGDLDLCILVGYPGSVMATWQRSGRVGRSGQESALALVAGEDALDQYFIHHPEVLMRKEPEAAVINPFNSQVLEKHLICAAAELPLRVVEPYCNGTAVREMILRLERSGDLLRDSEGGRLYAGRKHPHRHVDLRGTGNRFTIVCSKTGESRGEIDGFRAFKETHPGAVYLHRGDTYLVEALDMATSTVTVTPATLDYYTRVRGNKETEILEVIEEKQVRGAAVFLGRLKVTEQITGYEKWRIHGKKRLNIIPLDLPPLIFETEGIWVTIHEDFQKAAEKDYLHFMGGIHAMEHAMIGVMPFFLMTDRNDLGGISIPFHPQVGRAAVFVYDGIPGGAGLSRQAFDKASELLTHTHVIIRDCDCDNGCPACVHSPKCGSGNRPIDKAAAAFLLDRINASSSRPNVRKKTMMPQPVAEPTPKGNALTKTMHFGVLDLETQRSAQEVGGWHRADQMGISCVVLYDSQKDDYFEYLETQVDRLVQHLSTLDLIVGFNIKRFDYSVLSHYTDIDFSRFNTLDILEKVHERLGYRLSLDHLASNTLGTEKTADGLQALVWWKEGKISDIIQYCRSDVKITRDLFLFGQKNGYLLFKNKAGQTVRVPVTW